ncbi:hypothetical protein OROGR_001204 [Orobanche gracilis]
MAAVLLKVFAAVFVAFVVLTGTRVSAQTHHVLGGDGGCAPALDGGSWLSGRVFRVGDKIWFNCSGTEESIVELEGPLQFQSCDISNPIKMYTDSVNHVELEKEGIRYFTSGNLDSCKNGLKLPVPVQPHVYAPPSHESGPPPPHAYRTPPPLGPSSPVHPSPEYGPPEPIQPPPAIRPPPPSAATSLNAVSVAFLAGLLISYIGM